ncbi:MAG: hypothetical protein H6556_03440 [Lewinellaceae bacterium]|nr:hypothetical protein [Lewinellaceae bacterium]
MVKLAEPRPLGQIRQPPQSPRYLIFLLIGAILLITAYKGADFIEVGEDGKLRLSKKRREKMEREIENLKEAEQYVLVAVTDGWYPCFNCGMYTTIFLRKDEEWRYGVTIHGKKKRYGEAMLLAKGLRYHIQYTGTIEDCLIKEKERIYYYALLPENLKRAVPLKRPPGNKIDR